MLKILKIVLGYFGYGKNIPDYPNDFATISFSETALENGIKDNQNKVITRHSYNKYGNLTEQKIPYSEEKVHILKKISKIPVYDTTQKEDRFPIWGRIFPSEVRYTTR